MLPTKNNLAPTRNLSLGTLAAILAVSLAGSRHDMTPDAIRQRTKRKRDALAKRAKRTTDPIQANAMRAVLARMGARKQA